MIRKRSYGSEDVRVKLWCVLQAVRQIVRQDKGRVVLEVSECGFSIVSVERLDPLMMGVNEFGDEVS